jgi:hypothetical protein
MLKGFGPGMNSIRKVVTIVEFGPEYGWSVVLSKRGGEDL